MKFLKQKQSTKHKQLTKNWGSVGQKEKGHEKKIESYEPKAKEHTL